MGPRMAAFGRPSSAITYGLSVYGASDTELNGRPAIIDVISGV